MSEKDTSRSWPYPLSVTQRSSPFVVIPLTSPNDAKFQVPSLVPRRGADGAPPVARSLREPFDPEVAGRRGVEVVPGRHQLTRADHVHARVRVAKDGPMCEVDLIDDDVRRG